MFTVVANLVGTFEKSKLKISSNFKNRQEKQKKEHQALIFAKSPFLLTHENTQITLYHNY